jgi:hypothetical protein
MSVAPPSARPLVLATLLAATLAACASGRGRPVTEATHPLSSADVAQLLGTLAHDSMEGRGTGTRGYARAAEFVAGEMRRLGLEPAGDSGFFQRVPLVRAPGRDGRPTFRLLPALAARDTLPAPRHVTDVNVVGILRGSDPALRDEAILVDAHLDHEGIGAPENGDSIYNGADDDASGVVAVLGIARGLLRGPAPRRTVIFLATTGEEIGILGTRWYMTHPVVPLARTVANLEVEMIGRPDTLAGGAGRAWLTGFERSTLGATLRDAGIAVVPDPYPSQRFFERSDNIGFARCGIPAHTLSSFNQHKDYHTVRDEASRTDPAHMAAVIAGATRAVRLLAAGETPRWNPGGRPDSTRCVLNQP